MSIAVTITGADDAVHPGDLADLSEEFPFVEWGVLLSWSRAGSPRYPSGGWFGKLRAEKRERVIRTSLHLCGQSARQAMDGTLALETPIPGLFGRIQVNGWRHDNGVSAALRKLAVQADAEVILQCRSVADLPRAVTDARWIGEPPARCSILYDESGGRGVEPFSWPRTPGDVRCGFAGGITPDNVCQVIRDIFAATNSLPSWIDMESGVRTNDRFDIDKAARVLSAVRGLLGHSGRIPDAEAAQPEEG